MKNFLENMSKVSIIIIAVIVVIVFCCCVLLTVSLFQNGIKVTY